MVETARKTVGNHWACDESSCHKRNFRRMMMVGRSCVRLPGMLKLGCFSAKSFLGITTQALTHETGLFCSEEILPYFAERDRPTPNTEFFRIFWSRCVVRQVRRNATIFGLNVVNVFIAMKSRFFDIWANTTGFSGISLLRCQCNWDRSTRRAEVLLAILTWITCCQFLVATSYLRWPLFKTRRKGSANGLEHDREGMEVILVQVHPGNRLLLSAICPMLIQINSGVHRGADDWVFADELAKRKDLMSQKKKWSVPLEHENHRISATYKQIGRAVLR